MNIQLIVQLLVLLEETETVEGVIAQLESVLHAYGFQYYAIQAKPRYDQDAADPVLAARWPDGWSELYASRKYSLVDPSVRMMGVAQRPFRWRDALWIFRNDPQRLRMQRMMQEAIRFGLVDGYVFPIHGRNGLLGSLVTAGRHVELSPSELALFETAARKVFWRLLELRGEAAHRERVGKFDMQLTRREMEVILLLADGLTSNEISKTLEISNHTVDWYINGLQEKLEARNRQHVVASAFRMGFVA